MIADAINFMPTQEQCCANRNAASIRPWFQKCLSAERRAATDATSGYASDEDGLKKFLMKLLETTMAPDGASLSRVK